MSKPIGNRLYTILSAIGVSVAISVFAFIQIAPRIATAAPSSFINFQARLLSTSGAVVPDGNYNLEFKIYNVSSGGTAEWTESRTGANKVRVANGYLSVSLGSVTAFSGIDWNEEHWITMNIGGTGSASWDGEMDPRLQLTAVPHAFTADSATTLSTTSGGITNTLQFATPSGTNHTITAPNASGTILLDSTITTALSGSAFLQGGNSFSGVATLGTTDDNGINFITNNVTTFSLSHTGEAKFKNDSTIALQVQNTSNVSLFTADTTNMKIKVGGDVVAAGAATGTTATTSGTGINTTTIVLTGAAFADNDVVMIDNAGQDYYTRIVSGGGTNTPTVSPAVSYDNAATVTKYNVQSIGATSSDYSTQSNRFFQGYFLGGIVTGTGSTIYADGTIKSSNDLKINAGNIFLNGDVQFKNGANSSTAFQLQNNSAVSVFTGDTTNLKVQVGSATTDANAVLLIADSYNNGTDPTGVNGAIYYNTSLNKFRCYENGAWADCLSTGAGGGANTSLSNLTSTALNISLLPGNTSVDLGASSSPFRDLYLGGNTTNNFKLTGTATAARTLTLPDESGTLCTTAASAACVTAYGGGGGSGVSTVGTINGQTKSANGAVIASNTLYLQTADLTNVGLVSASTQTFGGAKTFDGAVTMTSGTTFNGGLSVTTGQTLTNAGSLLLTAISIGDKSVGGDIGSAGATVDVATSFNVTQTTASKVLTLPNPSTSTAGRVVYVSNVGSTAFTMYGVVISPNNTSTFFWNGSLWSSSGIDGSGANYIQNQSTSDQSADFRISGTGRANTALQAPNFDRYDSGTLTIGGPNATAISLSENTTITGTLQVNGATTISATLTTQNLVPTTNDTYSLGSSTARYKDLYLGPNSLHIGSNGDEGVLSYDTTHDNFAFNQNVKLAVSSYLNFGSISGVSGYGIRDNGGTLQVKDSGGSWVNITSLGSGSGSGGGGSGGGGGSNSPTPVIESYTSTAPSAANSNVSLTVPSGSASGDLLVAVVYADGGCNPVDGYTTPTGWVLAYHTLTRYFCSTTNTFVFTKIVSSETPGSSTSWTAVGGQGDQPTGGFMLRISGASSVFPVNTSVSRSSNDGSLYGAPSITTTVPNTLGIMIGNASNSSLSPYPIPNWNQNFMGDGGLAMIYSRTLTDADTYAAEDSTTGPSPVQAIALAIAPANSNGIYPGTALLQDNFNDNSLNATKWATTLSSGAAANETSQQMQLVVPTTASASAVLRSQSAYDMRDRFASVQFVSSNHPTYSNVAGLRACDSVTPANCLGWGVSNGTLYGYYDNGGVTTVYSTTYNSTTHKYWRLREAAGVTYWETSTDGTSWTTRAARNDPIDLSSVKPTLSASNDGGAVATSTTIIFDDFFLGTADTSVSYNPANYVVLQGGNTLGTTLSIGTLDAYNFNLLAGGATVGELDGTDGSATFHNSTNSTTGFLVQNSGGTALFTVDTANTRVYVGNTTGDTIGTTLVLDTKTDAGDPTGVNGAMYYNSSALKFRCYENGAWKDCINTIGNTLTLGDTSNAGTVQLSDGSSNTVGITASGVGTNYTLTLPTTVGSTSQCLRTDSSVATQLVFGSCAAAGGDGGVLTVGGIDGQAKSSNGAAIQGTTFYQQSATGSDPGIVTATTQTFGGNKTFSGTLTVTGAATFSSSINVTGGATIGSDTSITGSVTVNGSASSLIFSGVTTDITTSGNQDLTIAPNGTGNIRLGASDTTGQLIVLDDKTGTTDPTGINGGMYYNSGLGKFRCYQGSAWKNCDDPWTYLTVNSGSDFSTTSTSAVDATGLAFTPAANTNYEFECTIATRTTAAATNPRVGLAWSSGLTDGIANIAMPQTATGGYLYAVGNFNASLLTTAAGSLPNATQSWPATIKGTVSAGASPSGTVKVQFASETGTSVSIKAIGTACRYRSY